MQGVSNMAKILGSTEHWTQFPNLPPFQSHPNLWTLYGWNWDFSDLRTKTKKKEISFGLFCVNAQHLPTGSMASLHPQRCYLQRFRPRDYYFRGRISSKARKIHSNLACSIGRLSRHTKKTRAGREGQLRNKVTSSSKEIREISSINTCATRAMPSLHSDTSSCHGISQQTIQTRISFHDS